MPHLPKPTKLAIFAIMGASFLAAPTNAQAASTTCNGLPVTITSSARVIAGTSTSDVILVTGVGKHTINAGAGDDSICGTGATDVINGGAGNDTIFSKSGDDKINSGSGDDTVDAGSGNDTVIAGVGSDTIKGGAGADSLNGGDGSDEIAGGTGNDTISGSDGDDLLNGNAGSDSLNGGPDDDLLQGGPNRDTLNTGAGVNHCSEDPADTVNGSCTLDKQAPQITVMTIPEKVTAGNALSLLWNVSDDTAVDRSWFKISYNIGGQWITTWCGFPADGTPVATSGSNQMFLGTCPVPENAVNGNYSIFFSAADMFGKVENKAASTFQVVGGADDSEAPVVSNLALSASSLSAGETLDITWTAQDGTGVASVITWVALNENGFYDSQGIPYVDYGSFAISKTAGDEQDGTYRQRVTIKDSAPPGDYSIWFSATDVLGNRRFGLTELKFSVQ